MALEISSKINIDATPFFNAMKAAVAFAASSAIAITGAISGISAAGAVAASAELGASLSAATAQAATLGASMLQIDVASEGINTGGIDNAAASLGAASAAANTLSASLASAEETAQSGGIATAAEQAAGALGAAEQAAIGAAGASGAIAASLASAAGAAQGTAAGTTQLADGIKSAGNEAKKVDEEVKKVPNSIKGVAASLKSNLDGAISSIKGSLSSALSPLLGAFGGGIALKGVSSLVGSFQGLLEKGKAAMELSQSLSIGLAQVGISGEAGKKGVDTLVKSADALAFKFALPKNEVREFAKQALQLGGATGKANEDLTKLAIAVEKGTGGLVDGRTAIQLFSKGVADPEGAIALARLTKTYPALGAALKGIKDPAEATKKALDFFKPTFKELGNQAAGPLGSIQRLETAFGNIKSTLGKALIEGAAPFVEAFANNIIPAITSAVKFIGNLKSVITPLQPVFIAVGAAVGVAATALLGLQAVQFVNKLATDSIKYAESLTKQVVPAMQKVISFLGFQTAAEIEAAGAKALSAAAARAVAVVEAQAAAEEAAVAAESLAAAQARAVAAAEVVALKEAEVAATIATGGAEAEAAAVALASAQAEAAASLEVVAAKQLEVAVLAENAAALGVAATAAEVEAVATAEAAIAADASAFSFGAMWTAVTGPIGLAIAGIALLGVGLYALYKNVKPFQEIVDATFTFVVDVAKQIWDVIVEIGKALFAVGEVIFAVFIAQFQIAYAIISPVFEVIGDLVGSLLGLGSAADGTGGAMAILTSIFDAVKGAISSVKQTIEGVTNALHASVAVIGKVAEAAANFSITGIIDALSEAGEAGGKAFAEGFNSAATQDKFDKAAEAATKALEGGIEIKTKIADVDNIGVLQQSLVAIEGKLKPLEIKAKAGTLTNEEKKTFDELAKKAGEVSSKIKTSAPEAVAGLRTIVGTAGQLITVYDISGDKVDEFGKKSKAAFGKELQEDQKKYSDSLASAASNLEKQKKQLDEIKKRRDAAQAKGDTAGADKAQEDFDKLQGQITENQAKLKKGFEDGAKAGLLTAGAAEKVGTAIGFAKGEAAGVVEQLKRQGEEAKKTAADIVAIGKAFTQAGTDAKAAQEAGAKAAGGAKYALDQLKAGTKTVAELNEEFKIGATDEADAVKKLTALIKQQVADQETARKKNLALSKIAATTDTEQILAQKVAVAKSAEAAEKLEIQKREDAAAEKARIDFQTAVASGKDIAEANAELEKQLIKIKANGDKERLDSQIKTANAELAFKIKTAVNQTEIKDQRTALATLETDKIKSAEKANNDIRAVDGKALAARYEEQKKFFEAAAVAEVETSSGAVKLIEERRTSSTSDELTRLQDLNAARITLIAAESRKEIEAVISKNADVVKADENLKKAYESNNKALIESGLIAFAEARAKAGNSDEIVAIAAATNKKILAQNKESQAAIREAQLQGIEDVAVRTREIALAENEKTLDAALAAAKGNKQKELAAFTEFEKKKAEIAEQYAKDTATTTDKIVSAVQDAIKSIKFTFTADPEGAKRAADSIEKVGEQITALENDLDEGKIAYEDYVQKIRELEDQRAALYDEKRIAETINFGKAITEGLVAAAQQLADATAKIAQDGIDKALAAKQLAADTEIDIAQKTAEKNKAILEGRVKDAEAAAARLAELEGVKTKATEEAEAGISASYAATAVAMGSAFISMAADGDSARKAFVISALQGLQALVPIFIAEIFGKEVATKSFAGIATAAVLTGLLQGFVSAAKSAQGLAGGGDTRTAERIPIEGVGNLIKIDELGHEFVVNHKATAINERALHEINRRNITVEQYTAEQILKGAAPLTENMRNALFAAYKARVFDAPADRAPGARTQYGGAYAPAPAPINMTTNNYRTDGGASFDLSPITQRLDSLENTIVETRQNISVKTKTEVGGSLKFDGRDFHAAVEEQRRKGLY